MPELSRPHVRYRESFLAAMAEFVAEGRAVSESILGSDLREYGGTWSSPEGFAAYVEDTLREAERPRDPAFVAHTTWWWVEGPELIGRIDVRHELTPGLLEVGGHIGYDVRSSRRREGHATAMLSAVLPRARALGIERALITCDATNEGSRRVIEANGGVLQDQRGHKLRYWVPTA